MQETEINSFCKLVECPRRDHGYCIGINIEAGRYECIYTKNGHIFECAYIKRTGELKGTPSLKSFSPLNKDWQRDSIILVSAFIKAKENDKRSKKVASNI